MTSMTRASLTATALAALLALGLTGCSIDAVTDIVEGKEDVFSLEVGDCFNDNQGTSDTVTSVKKPECTEEHDNEAYFVFDLSDDEFPEYDETAIGEAADEGCAAEFEEFIGGDYDTTSLDYAYYLPSSESWSTGDREILCLAYDLDGPVTGSLKGKAADYPYEG